MIASVLDAVLPWRNAVFLRFCRSRLRLRKSIFWYLLTLIVTTFVVLLTYIVRTNSGTEPEVVARGLWIPLLIIQGLILMFKGTGSVAAGLIQDKIDQTLDYQRLTPVSPLRNLLGYLLGLPVLEYVMFALTLPHLAFIVVVGQIPTATLITVYAAFLVCVVLYHTIGIAAGMVMRRWMLGYTLSGLLVLLVNVILPTFVSQLGLRFFQYLSVWPVIGQRVLPLLDREADSAGAAEGGRLFDMAGSVPFFNWELSPFVFTLSLQGALIATFGTMALRRWKLSTKHALSKTYALAVLTGFIVLFLGNVWPVITRQGLPFPVFGARDLEGLSASVAMGLPLVYAFAVWALSLMLFAIIVPTHDDYVRGVRRAMKLGRSVVRPWHDDAGSVTVYVIFTAVALAGYGLLFREISAAGFLEPWNASPQGFWRLPVAFGLVVFYSALLIQAIGARPTGLAVLLLWLLPILVAIVVSAQLRDFAVPQAVIASFSPLAFLFMSAALPPDSLVMALDAAGPLSASRVGANVGLAFIVLQIAALWLYWLRRRREYNARCRSQEDLNSKVGGLAGVLPH